MSENVSPAKPIPAWLDPAMEVSARGAPCNIHEWHVQTVDLALGLGCDIEQALSVTAYFSVETEGGKHIVGNGWGQVKITKNFAEMYKKQCGENSSWWRDAQGHCYRAYKSYEDFLRRWLLIYVPCPPKSVELPVFPVLADFRRAGAHFHRWQSPSHVVWDFARWFLELLMAYSGGLLSEAKAKHQWHELLRVEESVKRAWVQSRLDVPMNSIFWTQSHAALAQFQHSQGMEALGQFDLPTLRALQQHRPAKVVSASSQKL